MHLKLQITRNYLKEFSFNQNRNIKKLDSGFSLVELMVSILITIFTSGAIMVGVTQAKSSLRAIQIEEMAFDYIQGLTEKMKGRISAQILPSPQSKCEKECIEADEEDNCIIYADEVCYDISRINTGSSVAKRFKIDTRIMWTDNFGNEKEMELSTVQLVMNKAF